MTFVRKLKEFIVRAAVKMSGVASIFIVALIFIFLLKEGYQLFKTESVGGFLLGRSWYPISEPPTFGILPLILGTLLVTAGAAVISVPLGIASAIYIAEVAPGR